MCDYSLHAVETRPAEVGETLITTTFRGTSTRGFASESEPAVAVCMLPGTELERFPPDVNLFVHRGFPNCSKSDSVFAAIRCEDDHGKGVFDRLERSCGGFGRGRRELPGSRAPA